MTLKASLDDGKAELKGGIEVPFFQHRRGDPGALVVAEARRSAEHVKGSSASAQERQPGGEEIARLPPSAAYEGYSFDLKVTCFTPSGASEIFRMSPQVCL